MLFIKESKQIFLLANSEGQLEKKYLYMQLFIKWQTIYVTWLRTSYISFYHFQIPIRFISHIKGMNDLPSFSSSINAILATGNPKKQSSKRVREALEEIFLFNFEEANEDIDDKIEKYLKKHRNRNRNQIRLTLSELKKKNRKAILKLDKKLDRIEQRKNGGVGKAKKERKITTGSRKYLLLEPLKSFLGESELSRQDTVKRIWTYIKQNKLQSPSDRREDLWDNKLKSLFQGYQRITVPIVAKIVSKYMLSLGSQSRYSNLSESSNTSAEEFETTVEFESSKDSENEIVSTSDSFTNSSQEEGSQNEDETSMNSNFEGVEIDRPPDTPTGKTDYISDVVDEELSQDEDYEDGVELESWHGVWDEPDNTIMESSSAETNSDEEADADDLVNQDGSFFHSEMNTSHGTPSDPENRDRYESSFVVADDSEQDLGEDDPELRQSFLDDEFDAVQTEPTDDFSESEESD
ncbi:Uaf30p NDAI_0E00690 [Naumovozyma dairenensis CBS 421]|uniref:DM2 domain-containing protein n=1 Tax=Naumovozyma dairenensis (strain ATCC 10597 / BCRC 20456 / CBS 421 / NBRC 0211 / NRRL Y-12639) TaxID=1071378 RepID=G0WAW5_NAUDC|nr:hypothetical protein NDAI_0E00690 [Naumovozyma dairenensis CBS 421]CCD24885.1 hypothetical protein NDAI_0E00690 [Naumovozyma dairenensis CBS 421]